MNGEPGVREAADELAQRVPLVGAVELLELVHAHAPRPADDEPDRGFLGTPMAQLSPVLFVPVEERPQARDLLRSFQQALADREQEDRMVWLAAYVGGGLLHAWKDFRAVLPSVDLHGLLMIMTGPVSSTDPPSATWDAVAFEWLHGVVHGEPPPEDWVREAASRRSLRFTHTRYDAAALAICEGSIPGDFLERLAHASPGVPLGRGLVEQLWRAQGTTAPCTEDAMAARIAGLDHVGRLGWDSEIDEDQAIGHLVGWLMRYDVVVDPTTFLATSPYAALLMEHRVVDGRAKGLMSAHLKTVREIRDELKLPMTLLTQLAFLAWALDQSQERVPLGEVLRAKPPHGRLRLTLPRLGRG